MYHLYNDSVYLDIDLTSNHVEILLELIMLFSFLLILLL